MQVTEKDEYDFGSGVRGNLLRKTVINYQSFRATPLCAAAAIFNRPGQIIVYDGSGNRVAETDYLYDNQTTLAGV